MNLYGVLRKHQKGQQVQLRMERATGEPVALTVTQVSDIPPA